MARVWGVITVILFIMLNINFQLKNNHEKQPTRRLVPWVVWTDHNV